jgi:16S rRNA (cytidine1402-2'-O)-methyltransferase
MLCPNLVKVWPMTGTLYVVATPIGNLEDITLRALRVLKEADLIAAEDTRHTAKLLAHYDIRTPLTSYHEHNERAKASALLARLLGGANIALVADAGTPAIADPGYRLVVAAAAADVRITPVPGPAALTAALSVAALPTDRFVFEGFLPEKKQERRAKLQALRDERRTLVLYEAPHRLKDALNDIETIFGDRSVAVAREMTKINEQIRRGRMSDVIAACAEAEVRGEVVIVVRGFSGESGVSEELLRAEIGELQAAGMRVKEIAELIGEKYAYSKKQIYAMALELRKGISR